MAAHDDDRIAYLAGEPRPSLSARERAELDELDTLLGRPATWAQPDAALEERIVAAIAEEAQAAPQPARRRGRAPRRPVRARRRTFAFAGLAAAAAAVALIAALATSNTSPRPQTLAMVVSGTPLAPAAHGSATLTRTSSGWRIELTASGLPRLANGRYYEAWLKSPSGALVPIGTFNDARGVTLWAGVAPTQFSALTVTQQLVGGDPASSGKRVLAGAIRRGGVRAP
jgi:hypothetical protein